MPINEGDSGGPLVNERGEVVGVAAAVAWESHGAGLFIDVRHVRELLGVPAPAAPSDAPPDAAGVYRACGRGGRAGGVRRRAEGGGGRRRSRAAADRHDGDGGIEG